mmetsp:Transcript_20034/g.30042  ORF Transcript_20034/g.30042 Transcript_20034/m.30042 type:complete len:730 (+) Transcript_20034:140-2329(+)
MNSEEETEQLLQDNTEWDLTSPLLRNDDNGNDDDGRHDAVVNGGTHPKEQQKQQSSLIHSEAVPFNDNYTSTNNDSHSQEHMNERNEVDNGDGDGYHAEKYDRKEITFVETTMQPRDYYQILLGAMFTMIFILLVSGSYFFEWSDTMLRVQVNTLLVNGTTSNFDDDDGIIDNRLELGQTLSVDLPLYKDATFQTTLGIFQSSHSNFIVFLAVASSIVAPVIYMLVHPTLLIAISSSTLSKATAGVSTETTTGGNQHRNRIQGKFSFLVKTIYRKFFKRIGRLLFILEVLMKYSMALIFINSLLAICTSKVTFVIGGDYGPNSSSVTSRRGLGDGDGEGGEDIENTDSIYAHVINCARGGLISYLIGLSFFGIGSLVILRKQWNDVKQKHSYHYHGRGQGQVHQPRGLTRNHSNDDALVLALNNGSGTIFSPPPSAFQQHQDYFLDDSQSIFSGDDSILGATSMDDDHGSNKVSFDDRVGATDNDLQQMTPLLSSDYNDDNFNRDNDVDGADAGFETQRKWPPVLEIVQFECGLLSLILLFPIMTLPLIRLEYVGLFSMLLDTETTLKQTTLSFWDIALSIISTNNNGRDIFGFVSIAFFWTNVVIIPVVNWIISAIVWFFSFVYRRENRSISKITSKAYMLLKLFQPFAFMTPFAISLFVTVSSLQQVTDFLFNQNGACQMIQNLLGLDEGTEECMIMRGHLLPGSYILLLQGLFTEFFVVLMTIKCK